MTTFSSRFGLIMATLGMAIGTGNLWRFPRVLAANGGGTFLIPWVIFLFSWSIPLLMVEFAIGRKARKGPVGAFASTFGANTAWRGGFVAFCTVAILFYYSVVSGWTMRYLGMAITGGFAGITAENGTDVFVDYTNTYGPAVTHALSIGLACAIAALGVANGIERASKVLVPSLFVVLIIAVVRGLTLDGAGEGLAFLTTVDWERLTSDHTVWLEALSQSAWSTGAGWGLMVCYAVYAGGSLRAGRECMTTGIGNNCASLLAALAIIPAVFALAAGAGQDPNELMTREGPASTGLTFIWIPVLFREMDWGGDALSVLFFLGLAFAALSSLIAMVELAVRTLVDLGMTRGRAVLTTLGTTVVLGMPSAINLPFWEGHHGLSVFQNQDWVWGVGLIVSGALLGFSVLRHGVGRFFEETIAGPEGAAAGKGTLFKFALTVLVPVQAVGLLGWWFWKVFPAAEVDGQPRAFDDRLAEWLDPTGIFSVGTCLVQWGVILAVLLLVNRKLAARSLADSPDVTS